MTVSIPVPERRRKRSHYTLEALTFQLQHIYEREDLHNFTLGDTRGLVIAQAGDIHESEVLAAYAPMLCKSAGSAHRHRVVARMNTVLPRITTDLIHVRHFRIDGQELYLTLLGRPGVYRDVSLYRAITGVRRIIDQRTAA